MNDRRMLLKKGRQQCEVLRTLYSESVALESVAKQIEYLIELEQGACSDRSRLKEITIGVLTAREIEPLDEHAAETFYQIASMVRRM